MDPVNITHISAEISACDFANDLWNKARPVRIANYWSGDAAPTKRSFEARLLWSDDKLLVRFDAEQHEPLVLRDHPDTTKKVPGLWDYDVCEVFIAPDRATPNKYFEFEVAPTGEWVDLAIELTPHERLTDPDYNSGIEAAATVRGDKVVEIIKVPFESLGAAPAAGDIWLGNIFRCVGEGPDRGYLAWRPTLTEKPAFHVPGAFGEFHFTT